MNRTMKHVLLGFMILLTTVVLVACTSAAKKVDKALEAITIEYAAGDSESSVTKDIKLPATSNKLEVTWVSKNSARITAAGVVTQSTKEEAVELVATIAQGDEVKNRTFTLTVKASSEAILATAIQRLNIPGLTGSTANYDLVLTESVTIEGNVIPVVWTSSNELVITTEGSVFRPSFGSDNVEVKLTGSLTFDGLTETKEFDLIVEAKTKQPVAVGNIKAIKATPIGSWIEATNVTVYGVAQDGFYIVDNSLDPNDATFVYTRDLPAGWIKVGSVVNVEGAYALGFDFAQIAADGSELVSVSPASGTPFVPTPAVGDISELAKAKLPASDNTVHSKIYTLEGFIVLSGNDNHNTYIVPVDGFTGEVDAKNAVLVYYKSNKDLVEAMAGNKVKIEVVLHGYRTDRHVWTVNYHGTAEDIEVLELTPQEVLNATKGKVFTGFETEIFAATDLTLVNNIDGVAITYASSNEALINPTTGKVTMPETGREQVTLTATLKFEGVEQKVTKVINVGLLEVSEIGDVTKSEAKNGLYYKVTGVVTSITGNGLVAIEDASGAIALSAYFDTPAGETLRANIGKTVTVTGTKRVSNGSIQLNNIQPITEADITDGTEVSRVDITALVGDNEALGAHKAKLILLTDAYVTDVKTATTTGDYGYKYITLTLRVNGETIDARMEDRALLGDSKATPKLDAVKIGDLVTVNATLSWYNNPQISISSDDQVVVTPATDQTKAQFDADSLTLFNRVEGEEVKDLVVEGQLKSVINWTSNNANAVVSEDGKKVTFGAVETDFTVVLTANVTSGDVVIPVTFNVLIKVKGTAQPLAALDFTLLNGKKGIEMKTEEVLLEVFTNAGLKAGFITKVEGLAGIYEGNGSGGGLDGNSQKVIKTGTGSRTGSMKLTLSEKVSRVVIVGRGWSTSDKVTINGVVLNLTTDYSAETGDRFGILVFEFEETDVVDFFFDKRVIIQGIEFF